MTGLIIVILTATMGLQIADYQGNQTVYDRWVNTDEGFTQTTADEFLLAGYDMSGIGWFGDAAGILRIPLVLPHLLRLAMYCVLFITCLARVMLCR